MSEGLNLQGIEQLIFSGSLAVQTHKRCSPGIWQNLCIRTKILPMQTRNTSLKTDPLQSKCTGGTIDP